MSIAFEEILNECIRAVEAGKSVEQVVADYPEYASDLRAALHTVGTVMRLPADPSPGAEERALTAFLQEAQVLTPASTNGNGNGRRRVIVDDTPIRLHEPLPVSKMQPNKRLRKPQRWLSVSSAVALLIGILGVYVFLRASFALPGEAFYAMKLQIEQAQLASLSDAERLNEFEARLEQRRIDEIKQLISQAQPGEQLTFEGTINEVQASTVLVEGIAVQIINETTVEGTPAASRQAAVEGEVNEDAEFVASFIAVEQGDDAPTQPDVVVTPNATETELVISEPEDTRTPEANDASTDETTALEEPASGGVVVEPVETPSANDAPALEPIRPATVVPQGEDIVTLEPVTPTE